MNSETDGYYSYGVDGVKFEIPGVRANIFFLDESPAGSSDIQLVPWDSSDFAADVAQKRKPDESSRLL